jgi:putative ABC transport system permease protein
MIDFSSIKTYVAHNLKYIVPTIISLSLSVALFLTLFSVSNLSLFKPLPYEDSERIVIIETELVIDDKMKILYSNHAIANEFRKVEGIEELALFNQSKGTIDRKSAYINEVNQEFFELFKPKLIAGSLFGERTNEKHVAVISLSYFNNHYGPPQEVIGKTILLNDMPYKIVGVVDEQTLPSEGLSENGSDVWVNMVITPELLNDYFAFDNGLKAITKHPESHSIKEINSNLAQHFLVISDNFLSGWPPGTKININAISLLETITQGYKDLAVLLIVSSLCVLLVVLSNITNVFLAKGSCQQRSISIKRSLGATITQVKKELFLEVALLTLCSFAVAIFVYSAALSSVGEALTNYLPRVKEMSIDANSAIAVLTIYMIVTAYISNIYIKASFNLDLMGSLRSVNKNSAATISKQTRVFMMGFLLVVLSLVINSLIYVSGTALSNITHSFGINTKGISYLSIEHKDIPAGSELALINDSLSELKNQYRVGTTSISTNLAITDKINPIRITSSVNSNPLAMASLNKVSTNYFQMFGLQLIAGDIFNTEMVNDKAIVISKSLADALGEYGSVGSQISINDNKYSISGIVSSVSLHPAQANEISQLQVYMPFAPHSGKLIINFQSNESISTTAINSYLSEAWQQENLIQSDSYENIINDFLKPFWLAVTGVTITVVIIMTLSVAGMISNVRYLLLSELPSIGVRLAIGANFISILREYWTRNILSVLSGVIIGSVLYAVAHYQLVNAQVLEGDINIIWMIACLCILVISFTASAYFPIKKLLNNNSINTLIKE